MTHSESRPTSAVSDSEERTVSTRGSLTSGGGGDGEKVEAEKEVTSPLPPVGVVIPNVHLDETTPASHSALVSAGQVSLKPEIKTETAAGDFISPHCTARRLSEGESAPLAKPGLGSRDELKNSRWSCAGSTDLFMTPGSISLAGSMDMELDRAFRSMHECRSRDRLSCDGSCDRLARDELATSMPSLQQEQFKGNNPVALDSLKGDNTALSEEDEDHVYTNNASLASLALSSPPSETSSGERSTVDSPAKSKGVKKPMPKPRTSLTSLLAALDGSLSSSNNNDDRRNSNDERGERTASCGSLDEDRNLNQPAQGYSHEETEMKALPQPDRKLQTARSLNYKDSQSIGDSAMIEYRAPSLVHSNESTPRSSVGVTVASDKRDANDEPSSQKRESAKISEEFHSVKQNGPDSVDRNGGASDSSLTVPHDALRKTQSHDGSGASSSRQSDASNSKDKVAVTKSDTTEASRAPRAANVTRRPAFKGSLFPGGGFGGSEDNPCVLIHVHSGGKKRGGRNASPTPSPERQVVFDSAVESMYSHGARKESKGNAGSTRVTPARPSPIHPPSPSRSPDRQSSLAGAAALEVGYGLDSSKHSSLSFHDVESDVEV